MADLIIRELNSDNEVGRVPVENPFSTIRGQDKYEIVMTGILRNMSDDYYIDDSEFDIR
jgi:hypothetical protein